MFLSEMLPAEKASRCVLVDKAWPMHSQHEVLPHQINHAHIYGGHEEVDDDDGDDGKGGGGDEDGKGGGGDEKAGGGRGRRGRVSYYDEWPISLHTSKADIKKSSTRRSLGTRLFEGAPGPVLLLAVHLCGTLALRAVEMFNDHERCR